jgi:hypothetical protein
MAMLPAGAGIGSNDPDALARTEEAAQMQQGTVDRPKQADQVTVERQPYYKAAVGGASRHQRGPAPSKIGSGL